MSGRDQNQRSIVAKEVLMFTTFSLSLKALLSDVQVGKIQLPDFSEVGYGTMTELKDFWPASLEGFRWVPL